MLMMIDRAIARRKTSEESGAGEIISILFITPVLLWFIFTMLDLFFYFEARREVQNITADAAQTVAILGGNNSRYNPNSNKTIAQETRDVLWNGTRCTPGNGCPRGYIPRVTCTPGTASQAMQLVSCTTTYKYRSVYNGTIFKGLADLTSSEFKVTSTARSQTGF